MTNRHRSVHFEGGFTLAEPVEQAFPLFSPVGEKAWVPGWEPELIYPPDSEWAEGQVFRSSGTLHPATWVVARLEKYRATYYRWELPDLVVQVDVRCEAAGGQSTRVTVGYTFVSLSAAGDEAIAAMSAPEYEQKMRDWKRMIDERA